jgi:hypothetical protein
MRCSLGSTRRARERANENAPLMPPRRMKSTITPRISSMGSSVSSSEPRNDPSFTGLALTTTSLRRSSADSSSASA